MLPWLPSDQELQQHLQRANGNVHTALNSVVDRWELDEENKDFEAQDHALDHPPIGDAEHLSPIPHLPLQSSDQFLKQLSGSSSADLIPDAQHFVPSEHIPGGEVGEGEDVANDDNNKHHPHEGEEVMEDFGPHNQHLLNQMFGQQTHQLPDDANFVEPALGKEEERTGEGDRRGRRDDRRGRLERNRDRRERQESKRQERKIGGNETGENAEGG